MCEEGTYVTPPLPNLLLLLERPGFLVGVYDRSHDRITINASFSLLEDLAVPKLLDRTPP